MGRRSRLHGKERLKLEGVVGIDEAKKKIWWHRPDLVVRYNEYVEIAERFHYLVKRFEEYVFDYRDIDGGWGLLGEVEELIGRVLGLTEVVSAGSRISGARFRMRSYLNDVRRGRGEWDVLLVRKSLRSWVKTSILLARHFRQYIEWGNEKGEEELIVESVPVATEVEGGVVEELGDSESRTYYDEVAEYSIEDDDLSYGRLVGAIDIKKYELLRMYGSGVMMGVDVARYGEDRTVIAVEQWGHIVDIRSFPRLDTMETCGRVVEAVKEYKPDEVKVDLTGGLGAGVYDRLRELGLGCRLVALEVQSGPRQEKLRAANLRSELYLNLEERLRTGTLSLPPDKELAEELVHTRYEVRSDGKIWIRSKDELRKALGRSPDRADAVACCAYRMPSARVYV